MAGIKFVLATEIHVSSHSKDLLYFHFNLKADHDNHLFNYCLRMSSISNRDYHVHIYSGM